LVVRKGGKEYCAKRTTWKYTQNKYHNFRIISKINGKVQVYIDKKLHMDVVLPSTYNLKVGTFGIFVAFSQIEFKNVQYKVQALKMPPPPKPKTVVPKFKDFTKGAFKNGETGSRDSGNSGKCVTGDWADRGSYWDQRTCNSGGGWFINKNLMNSKVDYQFSVTMKNRDNDDSGVVFRFKDKNNFIRFHHTIQNVYNNGGNKKHWIGGGKNNGNCISGTGSYLVVRKGGKEYCAKRTTWKYKQGAYHNFRIISKINGQVQVYIDKKLHMNVKLPSTYNLKVGTFGIFVAWSQIEFKNVQYKYAVDQPLS
jgi:hypothetical protein